MEEKTLVSKFHGKYDNLQWKSWNIHKERICKQATYLQMNATHNTLVSSILCLYCILVTCASKWNEKLVFILFISDSVQIFKFQLKNVKVSNCYFSYLSKGFLSNAINWVIEWSSEGLTDWLNDWLIGWLTQKFSFSPFPYNRDLGEHIRKLKKNFSPNLLISLLKIVAPKETVALAAHVTRK